MKHSKLFLFFITSALAITLNAEISTEKDAEIAKMLQLTGMTKLLDQIKFQVITSLKANIPNAPDGFWDKFSAGIDFKGFHDRIVPIYDKYYTLEDLKAINAFYSSPAGQTILAKQPQILHESLAVGQAWGQEIAKTALSEFAAEAKKNKLQYAEKMEADEATKFQKETQRQLVKTNLQMISDIADFCFRNNPQIDKISVKDLVAWTKSLSPNGQGALQLKPVLGEQYDNLVIPKNRQSIFITLPDGSTVLFESQNPTNQSPEPTPSAVH